MEIATLTKAAFATVVALLPFVKSYLEGTRGPLVQVLSRNPVSIPPHLLLGLAAMQAVGVVLMWLVSYALAHILISLLAPTLPPLLDALFGPMLTPFRVLGVEGIVATTAFTLAALYVVERHQADSQGDG